MGIEIVPNESQDYPDFPFMLMRGDKILALCSSKYMARKIKKLMIGGSEKKASIPYSVPSCWCSTYEDYGWGS